MGGAEDVGVQMGGRRLMLVTVTKTWWVFEVGVRQR